VLIDFPDAKIPDCQKQMGGVGTENEKVIQFFWPGEKRTGTFLFIGQQLWE